MDMSRTAVTGRLRAHYGRDEPEPVEDIEVARSFVVDVDGRDVIVGAARTTEWASLEGRHNPQYLYLQGALVGADEPNGNGAYWSGQDLKSGEPTVAHGPLNWLHDARHIVGALHDSAIVMPSNELASRGISAPYITVGAVVWRYIYRAEADLIQRASDDGQSFLSMECIAREVACHSHGCGSWAYSSVAEEACEHIRQRSGVRHMVDPTFLGAAVVLPPVRPGWASAHLEVVQRASAQAETAYLQAGSPDIPASAWELLIAQVIAQHQK